ncbi:hypothetical protein [Nocardioides sp.]|nr:hypothetical protein [Nocardioides sp.]HXH77149.1 hypothetical protein [Nocardioides sp.]
MTVVLFLARHPVAVLAASAVVVVTSGLVICLAAVAEADAAGVEL